MHPIDFDFLDLARRFPLYPVVTSATRRCAPRFSPLRNSARSAKNI
jgi:hypothetical protein